LVRVGYIRTHHQEFQQVLAIESILGRTNGWGKACGGAPCRCFGLKQAKKIINGMALDGCHSMIINATTNQNYMGTTEDEE
jgi:hypothetical protein